MILLDHTGPLLLNFLSHAEARNVRITNTAFATWFDHHQVDFQLSFARGSQWSDVVRRSPKLQSIRAFPNTFQYLHAVNIQNLRTLCLDNCGLTYNSIKTNGLAQALKKGCRIQDLSINDNPDLRTNGLARILHSLDIASATLQRLSASNTGIKTLYRPEGPVLRNLRFLDVSSNTLTGPQNDIRSLHLLEELYIDLETRGDTHNIPLSVTTLSWCHGNPSLTSSLLSSSHMIALSLSCTGPLPTRIGTSIRELSLAQITCSQEEWSSFLTNIAMHTCVEELLLCEATNLTGQALGTFIQHLPQHTKFGAFGLRHTATFTYNDLDHMLLKMDTRKLNMHKWILQDIPSLKFPPCAQSFVRTLDVSRPIYLDIGTRSILRLSRRYEALWINSVLKAATFSYLGLGGRSALLSTVPHNFLANTQQLSLENTEVNWGIGKQMRQLRVLSLYDVESKYLCADALFEQALNLPAICHLRADYCRLDAPIRFSMARYVNVLDLNWCVIGDAFRNSFIRALTAGKLPALTSLGIMGSGNRHASLTCLLICAMKEGHRRCSIDARGLQWTASQLKFLDISIKQLCVDDVSRLRINVRKEAQSEWKRLCLYSPHVLWN